MYHAFSVWSDDNWLKKHAGATLKEQEEAAEAEESAKRPAEDADEVKGSDCSMTIKRYHFAILLEKYQIKIIHENLFFGNTGIFCSFFFFFKSV